LSPVLPIQSCCSSLGLLSLSFPPDIKKPTPRFYRPVGFHDFRLCRPIFFRHKKTHAAILSPCGFPQNFDSNITGNLCRPQKNPRRDFIALWVSTNLYNLFAESFSTRLTLQQPMSGSIPIIYKKDVIKFKFFVYQTMPYVQCKLPVRAINLISTGS